MVRPKKEMQARDLAVRIKETAWRQIAESGAAALSLRAIARELKITAPAIYNYFGDRDTLVTALIIDAFTSFGDSQLAARDSMEPGDLRGQMRAIGLAYRSWAHAYSQRYQLIFGTPIPGYEAPVEQVLPASARSISALFSVVENLLNADMLRTRAAPEVHPKYWKLYELWKAQLGNVDPTSVFTAMSIWTRVHGVVSLELQGNLPPFGERGDALYMHELQSIEYEFIKES